MKSSDLAASTPLTETVGESKSKIPVEISTRFLEHFSEQLYSSPQKAFEELISNGWDAGATFVDVFVPDTLNSRKATLTVWDNGASMDEDGLKALWKIACSPKNQQRVQYGRQVVGKFGIGKLSTYVLANRLTYICKAEDGVIRRVTMDYGSIDNQANPDKLISDLELEMFELTEKELVTAVGSVDKDGRLGKLILDGPPEINTLANQEDEFGSIISKFEPPQSNTWTLVVLSGLKDTGRKLKVGYLKRMLEAALPMSSEISIQLNGEMLTSSKLDATVTRSWAIGANLGFEQFEVPSDEGKGNEVIKFTTGSTESKSPDGKMYHFVEIPEIGQVSGTITLFADKISGGKAQERGSSNGFLVNVLGRVINQDDPSFGADNHSHAVWARFRMAVRADGLDQFLTTSREKFRDTPALKVFRAFLRKCFNLARSEYDSDTAVAMPDGGDVLVQSLGIVSLAPLRNVVSEALRTRSPLPGLFDETGIVDREKTRDDWRENTADNIKNALDSVKYENTNDDEFVKFRLSDNTIVINNKHPFVAEHSRTKAEKELMRTVAIVSFLSDIYSLDAGVEPDKLESIRKYRDRLMRFRAIQRRQSGIHIAQILLKVQHNSNESKEMETVVTDALRYIGYKVEHKGGNGEPDGIAFALPYPTEQGNKPLGYKFTYDTKSTKGTASKTNNLTLDGVNEHKDRYKADYALVVAPGFQDGAVVTRCKKLGITPIKASDLGKLLKYTVGYGAISLDTLRKMFACHDPQLVSSWVSDLKKELDLNRKLTMYVFLEALKYLQDKVPDVLEAGTISLICRENLKVESVTDIDVLNLVKGLAICVPDLVGLTDNKIVVLATPERVAEAVNSQLEKLYSEPEQPEDLAK